MLHLSRHVTLATVASGLLIAGSACQDRYDDDVPSIPPVGGKIAPITDGMSTGISTSDARFVTTITGFNGPESVRYDPEQDVFFVSNMTGYGSDPNGNGYINRISASDPRQATIFAAGGKQGVVLDAPKGMAIHGDTLWVADITVLRGFDRHTGAPLANIDFAPQHAVLLNDVAVGPDGTVRVTDTGILMDTAGAVPVDAGRIFTLGPNRTITVRQAGSDLIEPNGITWDPVGKRWIVVSFARFNGEIAAMAGDGSIHSLLRTGPKGQLDGVEVLPSGAIMFSSWADSSVHVLENGRDRRIIRALPVPADIGLDTRRGHVAVPMSLLGWVQVWSLGPNEWPATR